jgi:hypothetical protein
LPANASGCDPHRASISSRSGQVVPRSHAHLGPITDAHPFLYAPESETAALLPRLAAGAAATFVLLCVLLPAAARPLLPCGGGGGGAGHLFIDHGGELGRRVVCFMAGLSAALWLEGAAAALRSLFMDPVSTAATSQSLVRLGMALGAARWGQLLVLIALRVGGGGARSRGGRHDETAARRGGAAVALALVGCCSVALHWFVPRGLALTGWPLRAGVAAVVLAPAAALLGTLLPWGLSGVAPDGVGVSRAFPSWKRSILTEIYLCHACSYHEVEDGHAARTGGAGVPRAGRAGGLPDLAPASRVVGCGSQPLGGAPAGCQRRCAGHVVCDTLD